MAASLLVSPNPAAIQPSALSSHLSGYKIQFESIYTSAMSLTT